MPLHDFLDPLGKGFSGGNWRPEPLVGDLRVAYVGALIIRIGLREFLLIGLWKFLRIGLGEFRIIVIVEYTPSPILMILRYKEVGSETESHKLLRSFSLLRLP